MTYLAFDTHKFVKNLTKAGMPDAQAELLADSYREWLTDRLVTKDDLNQAVSHLEQKFDAKLGMIDQRLDQLDQKFNAKNASLEQRLDNKIDALRKDMMVAILSAQIVTIVTICSVMTYLLSLQ